MLHLLGTIFSHGETHLQNNFWQQTGYVALTQNRLQCSVQDLMMGHPIRCNCVTDAYVFNSS